MNTIRSERNDMARFRCRSGALVIGSEFTYETEPSGRLPTAYTVDVLIKGKYERTHSSLCSLTACAAFAQTVQSHGGAMTKWELIKFEVIRVFNPFR